MYDIRKSLKSNVLVSTEITQDRIDALYFIYIQNCNDFGIPEKPKTCIEILCNQSSNSKDNVTVYFAELDGVVIGGLIMIWSKSVASYFLPCSLNEHRSLQSNTFLISIAIEEAKKRNIKIWNWESSPSVESGVYSFKQKWGSVNSDYNIYIKPLKEEQFFLDLGKTQIASLFPNYFVYPFTNITKD